MKHKNEDYKIKAVVEDKLQIQLTLIVNYSFLIKINYIITIVF